MCRVFKLNTAAADESAVFAAAEGAAAASGSLATILEALGVSDAAAAQAAIPELVAARAKLAEVLAELDALMQADAAADAQIVEADVAAAMTARGWHDQRAAAAVKAHRSAIIAEELGKLDAKAGAAARRTARAKGRDVFLQSYGVSTDPRTHHLTQTFVAGPGAAGASQQFTPPGTPVAVPPVAAAGVPQPLPMTGGPQSPVTLASYPGRNDTERAIEYLKATDPKFKQLDWGTQVRRAAQWRRDNAAA